MELNTLMDLLSSPQAAGARKQLSQQLGLSEAKTGDALKALLPALAAGLASNAQKPGGLDALLGALSKGSHDRYLDDPSELARPESLADGNAILGHLLGSKDISRAVAGAAAKKTGLDDKLLRMALPVIATMVMGQLSKKAKGGKAAGGSAGFGLDDLMAVIAGASGGKASGKSKGMLGGILSLFDANKDGSALDDIFKMVMNSRK